MKVNFNPSFRYNSIFSEFRNKSENKSGVTPVYTKEQIITAKTKKTISECKYIVIALGILYFAMKKNLKNNRLKNEAKKAEELAKMIVPKKSLININPEEVLNLH